MRRVVSLSAIALFLGTFACSSLETRSEKETEPRWGLAIHTGAGNYIIEKTSGNILAARRAAMKEALETGHRILSSGGSSLDAVEAAVTILEDSPYFNAGRGAVFTHDGTHELDAAIMDGSSLGAGAVASVKRIKNPVRLARLVMEKSPHVLLAGTGAEAFAAATGGMTFVEPSYFDTDEARKALEDALRKEQGIPSVERETVELHKGTVGAVALDKNGTLAAATSTGGMTNKRPGRIGDTPIIGAGTLAENACCAVSATGHGEYFIRYSVAHEIRSLVLYRGLPVRDAASSVVLDTLKKAGGDGGVIVMDKMGNVAMPFNTRGMGRGYAGPDGAAVIALGAEPLAK